MSVLVLLTCLFSSGCCCRENERLSKLGVAWGKQKSVVGGFHGEVAELGLFMCVKQVGTPLSDWFGRREERQSGMELRPGW